MMDVATLEMAAVRNWMQAAMASERTVSQADAHWNINRQLLLVSSFFSMPSMKRCWWP